VPTTAQVRLETENGDRDDPCRLVRRVKQVDKLINLDILPGEPAGGLVRCGNYLAVNLYVLPGQAGRGVVQASLQ